MRSSITITGAPGLAIRRIAVSTPTGSGRSWTHSKANTASYRSLGSVAASTVVKATRSVTPRVAALRRAVATDGSSMSKPSNSEAG